MRFARFVSSQFLTSIMLVLATFVVCQGLASQVAPNASIKKMVSPHSTVIIDPDVIDSEWNHHLAGYILIGSAGVLLLSLCFSRVGFLRVVWPFLFVAAGLFLLAWSDKEIWPRGFLSWSWLFHHDAEARQHKIYGILLLVMGAVEYLRWRGKLKGWGRTWIFPVLALAGACLLLVHDHGGNSGLPPGWDNAEKAARIAQMARASGHTPLPVTFAETQSAQSAMDMPEHHHEMTHMMGASDHYEGKKSSDVNLVPHSGSTHSGHVMTPAMLHITTQHLWFTLVGLAIALFKFMDDASFWRNRFVSYLWPTGMLILGSLLALYTETV
jgi:hypothetical protein